MSKIIIIWCIAIVFLAIMLFIIFSNILPSFIDKPETAGKPVIKIGDCRTGDNQYQCWEDLITHALKTDGLDSAFEILASLYSSEPAFAAECHGYVHKLGQAAYEKFAREESINLTSKTGYCGYGFYHGFMEALIQDGKSPAEAIEFCSYADKQLAGQTSKASIACYHGIGHGFVDGSDPRASGDAMAVIKPGLDICKKISDNKEIIYLCATGVFNSLAIAYNGNQYGLTPNREDPYGICGDQESHEFKRACYQEMNTLVFSVAGSFVEAAKFIKKIPELAYAQFATEQLAGVATLSIDNKYEEYISVCQSLETKDFCLRGLVGGTLEHGKPGEEYYKALELCGKDAWKRREKELCYLYLISSVRFLYKPEKAQKVCRLMPEEYRNVCSSSEVDGVE